MSLGNETRIGAETTPIRDELYSEFTGSNIEFGDFWRQSGSEITGPSINRIDRSNNINVASLELPSLEIKGTTSSDDLSRGVEWRAPVDLGNTFPGMSISPFEPRPYNMLPVSREPQQAREFPRGGFSPEGRGAEGEASNRGQLAPGDRIVRSAEDLRNFYRAQDDSYNCSAYSMAMAVSDHLLGRPINYGAESQAMKRQAAASPSVGYTRDLTGIANDLNALGLQSKRYQYGGGFNQEGLAALNQELDMGHTAVARVRNPRTGNSHYIYVAGRDANGNYILGDPDRGNTSHMGPVSPDRLFSMMRARGSGGGFVAAWSENNSQASQVAGTIANRVAQQAGRTRYAGNETENSYRQNDGLDKQRQLREEQPSYTTPGKYQHGANPWGPRG